MRRPENRTPQARRSLKEPVRRRLSDAPSGSVGQADSGTMPDERPRLSHRCNPWLSVCFADDRKLQARGNYSINDRPQVFYNTQFDPCLDMSAEQIAHGRNGQWRHIAACHPITSFGNLWLKGRWV